MDVKSFAVEDVITTSGTSGNKPISDVNSGGTGISIGGGSSGSARSIGVSNMAS